MAPSYTRYTHTHPSLDRLTGRLSTQPIVSSTAEVVQFRSIPFATIAARFKPAQGPLDSIAEDYDTRPHCDFTQWGYACPQVEQPRDSGGGSLGEDDVRQYDEFSCLNCTVTVPRKALEGELKELPVMVYLHGGGFTEGCGNISASHDTSRMVALSVEEGMPVVIVSLHYRLNWFGFFTSSELLAIAGVAGGGEQLAGFGGDASNVTAFGESGGSISLTHHLCAGEPLFQRAILQSGIVGAPGPSLEERDARYERLLKYLDIEDETAEARVEALRIAPVERLVQAVNHFKAMPMWPYANEEDPFYSHGAPPGWSIIGEQLRSCDWCPEIIVGDSSFEGFMLVNDLLEKDGDHQRPTNVLASVLRPADVAALTTYYDIDPSRPSNLLWSNTARLMGDFAFADPNSRVAHALSTSPTHKIYRYQVCLSNPFPGSKYSYVAGHHFVEILYLFLTFLERYPRHRRDFFAETAKGMARKWIGFANGRVPWREFREETGWSIAVFDDVRGIDVRTSEEDERVSAEDVWGERRYGGLRLVRVALERAKDADAARGVILDAFL